MSARKRAGSFAPKFVGPNSCFDCGIRVTEREPPFPILPPIAVSDRYLKLDQRLAACNLVRYVSTVPRKQKLKVYRTPAGFYDAYVAAPSQKAALEAWGSDRDLFTRGIAEQVTDESLMREPLENPGQTIRRSRGTAAEQLAALPPAASRRESPSVAPAKSESASRRSPGAAKPTLEKRKAKSKPPPKPKPKPPPKPRPDQTARDAARKALEAAKKQYCDARAALKQRAHQLAEEEAALDRTERTKLAKLTRDREKAEAAFDRKMRAWRA